ncbi:MAG: DUF554 domain-containing protein [Deltaproteobacteria bacterium HGW-Deltaproteobacteria-21]|nr:MAG: DUF554 domain-containing protein [Deltaproteobacteria bacterium HGW-Deltaproteobacteria-21]
MTGTFLNVIAILIGSAVGVLVGSRLSDRLRSTVLSGMGIFTAAVGMQMFFKTENALVVLGALILGALLGEWLKIEDWMQNLGVWLERRLTGKSKGASSAFVRGFLATSVLYCTGPMAVLGSISDGLSGDYLTLSIKSVLDGLLSVAFASTLGIGVAFSALPVFVYQGGISLLASKLNVIVSTAMMNEMTATGGILLIGIGISSMLELKTIRVGNFLPGLAIAPVIVYALRLVMK